MAVNSSGQEKIDGVRKEKERLTAAPKVEERITDSGAAVVTFLELLTWRLKETRKVDRVTANHYLSSTASQETSNIPFPCLKSWDVTVRHKLWAQSIPLVAALDGERSRNQRFLEFSFPRLTTDIPFHPTRQLTRQEYE